MDKVWNAVNIVYTSKHHLKNGRSILQYIYVLRSKYMRGRFWDVASTRIGRGKVGVRVRVRV